MLEQYEEILSIKEVCDILYIGRNRVYELLESSTIKAFRIGNRWKIPKAAVQEYILSQSNLLKK